MRNEEIVSSRDDARTTVLIVYALHAAGLFTVWTLSLVGVIIAYVKRRDAAGTPYASHYSNQITIFWVGLIGGVIGGLLTIVLVGWAILAILFVWTLYRVIKGALRARERRPYD